MAFEFSTVTTRDGVGGMAGKRIGGPAGKHASPTAPPGQPRPLARIEFARFLTLLGVDATTNADAGHKKCAKRGMEDGRWRMEFLGGAPFSIFFHLLRFLLFLALALFIAGCTPSGPRALLKGKKLLERGDYAGAVAQFKTATSLLATNAQAWNYLGVACQYAGQPTDAVTAYQRALALDRDLMEAHYNLGCLWLEQNKPDAAEGEFTAYTLRRPKAPEGWLKLGLAQLQSHDVASAEKSFSTALYLNPNNAEALNGLGLAWVERGRPHEAAQFFAAAARNSRITRRPAEPGDGGAAVFARQRAGAAKLSRVSGADAAPGELGRGKRHREQPGTAGGGRHGQ
jgi:Flp pilus assembly protein TadD